MHPQLHLAQRLCSARQMRQWDEQAIGQIGIPGAVLMENAAHAVADFLCARPIDKLTVPKLVICCGTGNNGGDGYALARLIRNRCWDVTVCALAEPKTADALHNARLWSHWGVVLEPNSPAALAALQSADWIVDAIFGTGLERVIQGKNEEWINLINTAAGRKIGLDIPSGVHADTGQVLGVAVQCTDTIALQMGKQGCYQYPGKAHAGQIQVVDISIPCPLAEGDELTFLSTPEWVKASLPKRLDNTHKGNFGHILTVCGSQGMGGAAILAGLSALRTGAGLVTLAVPRNLVNAHLGLAPELMSLAPDHGSAEYFCEDQLDFILQQTASRDVLLLGCGLGSNASTQSFVRGIVSQCKKPIVIDADGLNHLQADHVQGRSYATILTPHPKELSRLSGLEMTQIQQDRIGTVRKLAKDWGVVLLLKGAYSVIGDPQGQIFINPTGNSALAKGGMGDVLSGIIASLMAQGHSALSATVCGAYVHGLCADFWTKEHDPSTLIASDLIQGLDAAFKCLN